MRSGLIIVLFLLVAGCGKKTASSDAAPPARSAAMPSAITPTATQIPAAAPATGSAATSAGRTERPTDMIDADLFLEEYGENELRADASYKGKLLIIRGKIGEVRRSPEGAYLTLTAEDPRLKNSPATGKLQRAPAIHCHARGDQEADLASLSRGDVITPMGKPPPLAV